MSERVSQRLRPDEIGWLALAVLLVPVYVNTFPVWRWLLANVAEGTATALPIIAGIAALALAAWWYRGARREGRPVDGRMLLLGGVLAGATLLMTDPAYPAKRIHVAEYILLAVVVRRALCRRLAGAPLALGTLCVTAVLGYHDELLQGLHPDRRFAAYDVLVNAMGGAAGAAIGHGAALFAGTGPPATRWAEAFDGAAVGAMAWSLVAAGLTAAAVDRWDHGAPFPLWMFLPVLAAAFNWLLVTGRGHRSVGTDYAAAVVVFLTLLSALPPAIANVFALPFA